jgi:TPP-dependent 2-oxoacid decarboxylase
VLRLKESGWTHLVSVSHDCPRIRHARTRRAPVGAPGCVGSCPAVPVTVCLRFSCSLFNALIYRTTEPDPLTASGRSTEKCPPTTGTVTMGIHDTRLVTTPSPGAGDATTISVGIYLASRLRQLGVEHLFGMPGDFNLALLDDMLNDPGLRWVGSTNELNAAYATDGYARIRGFGALVTTYGVGELSAFNGIAGAYAESVPLVQITGASPSAVAAAGSLVHHTLMDGDFAHFVRAYGEVTAAAEVLTAVTAADRIDEVLATALRESRPVYLSIPVDVAAARIPADRLFRPIGGPRSDSSALARFTASLDSYLAGYEDVTVLAGHLARRRRLELPVRRLADTGRASIATLVSAKGLLDEGHPAALGTYIGAFTREDRTRRAVETGHPLILVGTVLSDLVSGMFSHQVDMDDAVVLGLRQARIGQTIFDDVDLADSLGALTQLLERVSPCPPAAEEHPPDERPLAAEAPSPPTASVPEPGVMSQTELWTRLQGGIQPGTVLLADAGTAYYGAADLRLPAGCDLVGQPMWASIGYALPALLGVQLAVPDRRPVLLIGDGAAQLTVQELAVILDRRLTPVIILLNNSGYTVERAIRSPDALFHDITPWDWTALATSMAGDDRVFTVTSCSGLEFADALRQAGQEKERAVFIEVMLGKHDVPPLLADITEGLRRAQSKAGGDGN